MKLAEIEVDDFGGSPVAVHNYPCPVYWTEEPAVYMLSDGYFAPSWKAQQEGWRMVRATNWIQRLALHLFTDARPSPRP